ncbi:MAG: hypothetical protein PF570_08740 [Candidatus Cloacimonetes bacterium]|jgi:multidrug resistance efflux pump|nr:hypothetical protein [Candidatus Cloacimonadota bacterium]
MKKSILLLVLLVLTMSLFGVYNVGDIVDNYTWTDNTGAAHDIYELTAQGVAIVFFWGGYS